VADIFDEIDEDLRKDKAKDWWRQYGKYVIAFCVAAVTVTAGYTWHQDRQRAELYEMSDRYAEAQALVAAGDPTAAAERMSALGAEAGDTGIGMVARFQAAGLMAENGDHAGAAAAFAAIADDSSVDALYRDLADVFSVLQSALAGDDRAQLLTRLEPMTRDGETWRFTARMIAASLAIGIGDTALAEDYLKRVADDAAAPTSARAQAAEILQALEP
jgi:hypothetical protein